MKVVIIHSQVAQGFVGSNTTALVLKLAGIEVIVVPTVLYSNHLGHAVYGGGVIPDELFREVVQGIQNFGGLEDVDFVMTGFFGTQKQIEIAAEFIRGLQEQYPHIAYLCDPVMGDIGKGQYVSDEIPGALSALLVPLADYLTPNLFEAQILLKTECQNLEDLRTASKKRLDLEKQTLIITGINSQEGSFGNYYVNGNKQIFSQIVDVHPPGTGELFAAHLLLSLLNKQSVERGISHVADLMHRVMAHMQASGRKEFALADHLFSMES